MARVLLSAPANRPWATGPHLAAALRELGHEVRLFDFRSERRPDARLLAAAEEFGPRVHVIWKGERYRRETLRVLSARGVCNVLWHSDANVPAWLPPLARASDLCCVQAAGMIAELERAGVRDAQWLMEGITPSCFEGGVPAGRRDRFACEVALVGTVGRRPAYRARFRAVERLLREGFRVRWWGPPLRGWFQEGRWSVVGRAWAGGRVWNETYAEVCRRAKVFLAIPSRPEVPGGLSNRAFIATGLGAFYLSLYRRGIEDFFEVGREIEVFRDEDEMVEKVRYYLAHEGERAAVAAAGRRRTRAHYTNHHAFRRLFRLLAERGIMP